MTGRPAFLRTRVARRIFLSFVVSALLPITVLAIVAYWHVAGQLERQGQERLRDAARTMGQGIHERMAFLHSELSNLATALPNPLPRDWQAPARWETILGHRLLGLALVTEEGRHIAGFGETPAVPPQTQWEEAHLSGGGMLLRTFGRADERRVVALKAARPDRAAPVLLAHVDARHLWSGGDPEAALGTGVDLCLLDDAGFTLDCSRPLAAVRIEQMAHGVAGRHAGSFPWSDDGVDYLAGFWSPSLHLYRPTVAGTAVPPQWRVILSEPMAAVLSPMVRFQRTFPLVVLLAVWVVLLLSNIQIRRSTAPLSALQAGTQRVAERDFTTPVRVQSGDEFEDLAGSFNTMASQLDAQFRVMTAMNRLDRAVLSSLDRSVIMDTVLAHGREFLGCDAIIVGVAEQDREDSFWTIVAADPNRHGKIVSRARPEPQDLSALGVRSDLLVVNEVERLPQFLRRPPFIGNGYQSFTILPIQLQNRTAGVIAVAYRATPAHDADDRVRVRQLVDQMGVALANTRLFEQLESLKVGALTALARTIDAKSPWTAGHSERVAAGARLLGQTLGMSADELEMIHRGSLLHDIGKIGVSAHVLDKPGPLTPAEEREMQSHPELGVRILAPIEAYSDVIPIVLHHHEKIDGTGYPAGLRGAAIPFPVRVVAVADVYDALTSDRPYRRDWTRRAAIAHIRDSAGTQFDQDVVQAFLEAVAEDVMLGARSIPLPLRLHPERSEERV